MTNSSGAPLFQLGQIVATRGYLALFDDEEQGRLAAISLINRHMLGDYGHLCEEDAKLNNSGLSSENPGRIMSTYRLDNEDHDEVWVITEWDRSVTTILLPEEY